MQTFEHPNEMKIHRNYSLPLCSRKSEIYKTKISQKIKYKTQIPTDILEMEGWRVNLKLAWSILAYVRKLQRVITLRIENRKLEEILLMEVM